MVVILNVVPIIPPYDWQDMANFWKLGNFEGYGDEFLLKETFHLPFFERYKDDLSSYVNEHGWEKQPISNEMAITDG